MGCGCKKKKIQQGLTSAAVRSGNSNEGNINEANLKEVENSRAYQNKVRDALKQLMELKKRKRKLNQ